MLRPRSLAAVVRVYGGEFLLVLDLLIHARRDKRRGWGLPPT
jgi:hypothetical protein